MASVRNSIGEKLNVVRGNNVLPDDAGDADDKTLYIETDTADMVERIALKSSRERPFFRC